MHNEMHIATQKKLVRESCRPDDSRSVGLWRGKGGQGAAKEGTEGG